MVRRLASPRALCSGFDSRQMPRIGVMCEIRPASHRCAICAGGGTADTLALDARESSALTTGSTPVLCTAAAIPLQQYRCRDTPAAARSQGRSYVGFSMRRVCVLHGGIMSRNFLNMLRMSAMVEFKSDAD